VVHDYIEEVSDLYGIQGLKYVQSRIGNSYKQTKSFLRENRTVLFSGIPCQIAGLKKYLRKKYVNLTIVDFVCYEVSSL